MRKEEIQLLLHNHKFLFSLAIFLFSILCIQVYALLSLWQEQKAELPKQQNQIEAALTLMQVPLPTPTSYPKLSLSNVIDLQLYDCPNCWELVVSGDVMLGRSVNVRTIASNNPDKLFGNTIDLFRKADVALINLESPFANPCYPKDSGMVFCADDRLVEGLTSAGIDVVSLANNHYFDQGKAGVEHTVEIVESNNMTVMKDYGIARSEVNGVVVAFVGAESVNKPYDAARFESLMQEAVDSADVVIPFMHWGVEYTAVPHQSQITTAHRLIELGADLVLGNHPHWVQGVEIYQDTLIAYSHGNTVFDQLWSEETRQGVIGRYLFQGTRLIDVAYVPVYINRDYRPELADELVTKTVLERMRQASVE